MLKECDNLNTSVVGCAAKNNPVNQNISFINFNLCDFKKRNSGTWIVNILYLVT